jgi:hypothetical protein
MLRRTGNPAATQAERISSGERASSGTAHTPGATHLAPGATAHRRAGKRRESTHRTNHPGSAAIPHDGVNGPAAPTRNPARGAKRGGPAPRGRG